MNISWERIDSFVGNFSSPALLSYRSCPVCGSIRSRTVTELNDFQFYSDSAEIPKQVSVRQNQCLTCFAVYLDPCYSEFGVKILFAEADQSYGATEGHYNEQIEWMESMKLLQPNMQVLDTGCYDGKFLAQLPKDVKKVGVDVDKLAIERGRQQFGEQGVEFILGNFETFQYAGTPDVITMFHVLEHLPRPIPVLRKLRSIAHSTTRIVVEVPILENGITNDINGFFITQHTTHFSRNSLRNCLALAGWEIEQQHETLDYNGYRVLATPQLGAPLDYPLKCAQEDWVELNDSLTAWHSAIGDVEKIIQELPKCGRFVIWGGGAHTELLYQVTSLFHARRQTEFVIVDSDPIKHGKTWRGIPIYDPSRIKGLDWASTNLLISSYAWQEAIVEAAGRLNVPAANIIRFYGTIRRY